MENDVTVTVSIVLKSEEADRFCNVMLPELQKQTRAFHGVRSARAVRQEDKPNKVLFIDVFASLQDADAYFSWRKSTGDLDVLAGLVAEPPLIEVWPLTSGADC